MFVRAARQAPPIDAVIAIIDEIRFAPGRRLMAVGFYSVFSASSTSTSVSETIIYGVRHIVGKNCRILPSDKERMNLIKKNLQIPIIYEIGTTLHMNLFKKFAIFPEKLERRKVKAFYLLTKENEFKYALAGAINLNMTLPLSYLSLCTTYLVIIIQFSKFID